MTGYTKLFGSIIASTIWRESKETKIVWITMLAMAKKDGVVEASLPGLAVLAGVTLDEAQTAVNTLLSSDQYSRTKEHEGRRITTIEGGWHIINHAKYRAKMGSDERREYLRLKQQESRARKKTCQQPCQQTSTMSTHAEADAEAGTKHERESVATSSVDRPSREEVVFCAVKIGLAEWKALDWFAEMEGCGWLDYNHRPIAKWQAVLARVKTKWEADGRPSGPPMAIKPAPVNNSHPKRPLSPMDLKTIIGAKENEAAQLRQRHCSEVALGSTWSDDKARTEFFRIKREIKKLNHQLSSMA